LHQRGPADRRDGADAPDRHPGHPAPDRRPDAARAAGPSGRRQVSEAKWAMVAHVLQVPGSPQRRPGVSLDRPRAAARCGRPGSLRSRLTPAPALLYDTPLRLPTNGRAVSGHGRLPLMPSPCMLPRAANGSWAHTALDAVRRCWLGLGHTGRLAVVLWV